jgi:hypothetical protein
MSVFEYILAGGLIGLSAGIVAGLLVVWCYGRCEWINRKGEAMRLSVGQYCELAPTKSQEEG